MPFGYRRFWGSLLCLTIGIDTLDPVELDPSSDLRSREEGSTPHPLGIKPPGYCMKLGIAADHGGFELKAKLADQLRTAGHTILDFGAHELTPDDDFPTSSFCSPKRLLLGK
jgi:hypothetical protein